MCHHIFMMGPLCPISLGTYWKKWNLLSTHSESKHQTKPHATFAMEIITNESRLGVVEYTLLLCYKGAAQEILGSILLLEKKLIWFIKESQDELI